MDKLATKKMLRWKRGERGGRAAEANGMRFFIVPQRYSTLRPQPFLLLAGPIDGEVKPDGGDLPNMEAAKARAEAIAQEARP
jgi:hypothetical protein